MANRQAFVKNLLGARSPLMWKGRFAAGASTAIDRGEILEFTDGTNTLWRPLDSDFDMDGSALGSGGLVSIAGCQIKSGDLAGYYPVIVAGRPGDVYRFALLSSDAQNPAFGTAVYYSSDQVLTTTAGTNVVGHVAMDSHYPQLQSFGSDGHPEDKGTTIRSVHGGEIEITIRSTNGLWDALQDASA